MEALEGVEGDSFAGSGSGEGMALRIFDNLQLSGFPVFNVRRCVIDCWVVGMIDLWRLSACVRQNFMRDKRFDVGSRSGIELQLSNLLGQLLNVADFLDCSFNSGLSGKGVASDLSKFFEFRFHVFSELLQRSSY